MTIDDKKRARLEQFCRDYIWDNPLAISEELSADLEARVSEAFPCLGDKPLHSGAGTLNQRSVGTLLAQVGAIDEIEALLEALVESKPRNYDRKYDLAFGLVSGIGQHLGSEAGRPKKWPESLCRPITPRLANALAKVADQDEALKAPAAAGFAATVVKGMLDASDFENARVIYELAPATKKYEMLGAKGGLRDAKTYDDIEFNLGVAELIAANRKAFTTPVFQDLVMQFWANLPELRAQAARSGSPEATARLMALANDGLSCSKLTDLKKTLMTRITDLVVALRGNAHMLQLAKREGATGKEFNSQVKSYLGFLADLTKATGLKWPTAEEGLKEELIACHDEILEGVDANKLFRNKTPEALTVVMPFIMTDCSELFSHASDDAQTKAMLVNLDF